jgi:hypothetical protein
VAAAVVGVPAAAVGFFFDGESEAAWAAAREEARAAAHQARVRRAWERRLRPHEVGATLPGTSARPSAR